MRYLPCPPPPAGPPTASFTMLTYGQRLVILGSYGIKIKSGEASIYGAILNPSETIHWVHAPHCHALPVLRCSEKSIIELHPHPAAAGLRSLEKLSPIFAGLWDDAGPEGQKKTWQVLGSSADGPKRAMLQDLKSPPEWNRKIAELSRPNIEAAPPVLLVCGPKSSGKSTFVRMLTNRLVTHQGGTRKRTWAGVAVLDIDPGQPEFSPPGTISLVSLEEPNLSPPFCHPLLGGTHTLRSHAVASITPASDTEHYRSCVSDLLSHYRSTSADRPLIINTPGWIQGSGLVLLQDLISETRPSEAVYMSEDGPGDTVEGLRSACSGSSFSTLPSQSSEYTSRTALHLRHMQAMSYFHSAEAGRWDPACLASTPPLLVRYSGGDPGLLGIVCYGYQPEPDLLADAIDGTILAIVQVEDDRAFGAPSRDGELVGRTPEQLPYIRTAAPLDPTYASCIGLALVRGINVGCHLLAVSSPLPAEKLSSKKIVLVAGRFDTPTWAYTEEQYERGFRRRENNGGDEGTPTETPWVETLRGNQKKVVGSRVWRVRRDLGKNSGGGG